MQLAAVKPLDITRVGDLNEGLEANIDMSSLPFVFELVSKQLYSNPIGSVIREITSNCFDSHIEAGVNDPVIISKTYDADEGYAINFKDVGVGISPDRIEKIYMNYFSSTKRSDNTQIGGFGIGSKTPLAYTDMFYITTVYNGKKYEYLFHKGESKPTLESLLGYDSFFEENSILGGEPIETKVPTGEGTEEHNGTVIKIIMEQGDDYIFKRELEAQLAYFDNVYFKGWNISNDYDIYEGDYFKFRSDMSPNEDIHICIGNVRYPIDFSKINIPYAKRKIPIAVKFNIGELLITPSREALRYNEEMIALIQERVNAAIAEVIGMFEAQNPEIESLKVYNDLLNDTPKITFSVEKRHYLYIHKDIGGIAKNYRFKPLSGLNIGKTPKNMFFMWEVVGIIKNERRQKLKRESYYVVDNDFILDNTYVILRKEDKESSYTDIHIGRTLSSNEIFLIRRKEMEFKPMMKELGIKEGEKSKVGKAKTMIEYLKIINGIVHEKGYKYSALKPTADWVKEYQKSVKESSAAYKRKVNKKVYIRDIGAGTSKEVSLFSLQSRKGITVYGLKEDKKYLENIFETVSMNKQSLYTKIPKSHKTARSDKSFMVIQVSKAVEMSLLGANTKLIYYEDFVKTKFFRKICTAYYMYAELYKMNIDAKEMREYLIEGFKRDYLSLQKLIRKHYDFNSHHFAIEEKHYNKNYMPDMIKVLEDFRAKYVHDIPLLSHVNTSITNHPSNLQELVAYLKTKKIRLKNHFYFKSFTQQSNTENDS